VLVAMAVNPAGAMYDVNNIWDSIMDNDWFPGMPGGPATESQGDAWYPGMPGGPATESPGDAWYPGMPGGPATEYPIIGGPATVYSTDAPRMPTGPATLYPVVGGPASVYSTDAPSIPTQGPAGVNHITGPGGVKPTQNPAFTFDFPSFNDEAPDPTTDPTVTPPTPTPVADPTTDPTLTPTTPRDRPPTLPPTGGPGAKCPKDYVVLKITDGNHTIDLPSPTPDVITILAQDDDFVEFVIHNVTSMFGISDNVFTSFESGTFGQEICEMDEDLGTVNDPASKSEPMKAFCRDSDEGGKIALVKMYARYPFVHKKGTEIGKCCADPYEDKDFYTVALSIELKCRVCEEDGALLED